MMMKHIYLTIALVGMCWLCALGQNGLHFDGSSDYISATPVGLTGTVNRTVECWVKTTFNGTQNVLIDMGALSPNGSRFTLNFINGIPRIEIGGGGINAATTINNGAWRHVAATYDNAAVNKFSIYVDGVLSASGNIAQAMNTVMGTNLLLGTRVDLINRFNGTMDEVRVWNYARSASQINADKSVSYCTAQPGLIAYYKFNQGVAGGNNASITTARDHSGFNRTGTLNTFALAGATSNWVVGTTILPGIVGSNLSITGCQPFLSPSGHQTWTSSGNYLDTIPSAFGCDSVMNIALTILPNSSSTLAASGCFTYTSPSGQHTWTSSGTYLDTLTSFTGCDSIITINLTINTSTSSVLITSACDSLISPSGHQIWSSSGMYQDTLQNVAGCDSLLTVILTVNQANAGTAQDTACVSYSWAATGQTYTSSGTYTAHLTNVNGCDSLATLDLVIYHPSTATIMDTACNSYTWSANGQTYASSGTYSTTIANAVGCDSVVTLQLTIHTVDTSVTHISNNFTANASPATYNWLDCDLGYQVMIPPCTTQLLSGNAVHHFACEVTQNGCVDTSSCYLYLIIATDPEEATSFSVYPNPSQGSIMLRVDAIGGMVEIVDAWGAVVYRRQVDAIEVQHDLRTLAAGAYSLRLVSPSGAMESRRLLLLPR
jgi:Concanavalin A-like lectin/glucanases superfamily